MAIIQSEIQFFLSGGAGNSDPNASLGGVRSTTQITTAQLANLFANVAPQEAQDGSVRYRALYILNSNASLTWENAVAFLQANTPSADTTIDISVATEAIGATIQTIVNDTTAPTGQTFTAPSAVGTGLALGSIGAGTFKGIWVRRTVNAGASAIAIDNAILRGQGGTAP